MKLFIIPIIIFTHVSSMKIPESKDDVSLSYGSPSFDELKLDLTLTTPEPLVRPDDYTLTSYNSPRFQARILDIYPEPVKKLHKLRELRGIYFSAITHRININEEFQAIREQLISVEEDIEDLRRTDGIMLAHMLYEMDREAYEFYEMITDYCEDLMTDVELM